MQRRTKASISTPANRRSTSVQNGRIDSKSTKPKTDEKKTREKEKRAAKKAEIAELVKLGREARESGAAKAGAAVPEPKAAPASGKKGFFGW